MPDTGPAARRIVLSLSSGTICNSAGGLRRNVPTRNSSSRSKAASDTRACLAAARPASISSRAPPPGGSGRSAATLPPAMKNARAWPGSAAGATSTARQAPARLVELAADPLERVQPVAQPRGVLVALRVRTGEPAARTGQRKTDARARPLGARRAASCARHVDRIGLVRGLWLGRRDDASPRFAARRSDRAARRVRWPAAAARGSAAAPRAPPRAPSRARAIRSARRRRAPPRRRVAAARSGSRSAAGRAGRARGRRTAPARSRRGRDRRPDAVELRKKGAACRTPVAYASPRAQRVRIGARASSSCARPMSEQHLGRRLRVGERAVTRLHRRPEEIGELAEARGARSRETAAVRAARSTTAASREPVRRSVSRSKKRKSKRALCATRYRIAREGDVGGSRAPRRALTARLVAGGPSTRSTRWITAPRAARAGRRASRTRRRSRSRSP